MSKNYHFEHQEEPTPAEAQVLFDGICDEAALKKHMERIRPFSVFIKDSRGAVFGGASGVTYYGSLYVDMLWLKEELRGHGLGKKIMMEAERIGKERNCTFATVNTMDWEGLSFYQKIGYYIEFVREGYQKNSTMYFLRKEL